MRDTNSSQPLLFKRDCLEQGIGLEREILLCCARTDLTPHWADHLRTLLNGNVNWEVLIQTATNHGLIPLLYQHLAAINGEGIPETVLANLHAKFCANLGQNLALTSELINILDLLAAHQIQAMPFKGPVLTTMAYGNIALRQFSDLDIFVEEQDVPNVTHLLIERGYELPAAISLDLKLHGRECPFFHPSMGITIDLHWSVTPKFFPFAIRRPDWWQRQSVVRLNDQAVPTFSAEDTLLLVCVQAANNLWLRFSWICDVAGLINNYQLDWEEILTQAQQVGCERILLIHLFLAQTLLDIQLPKRIEAKLKSDDKIQSLAQLTQPWLCSNTDQPEPFGQYQGLTLYLRMRERFWHRLLHLRYLLQRSNWFTPSARDQRVIQLPAALNFLYYLIRPIRLFRKYLI
jgi:hypothetical protein